MLPIIKQTDYLSARGQIQEIPHILEVTIVLIFKQTRYSRSQIISDKYHIIFSNISVLSID
jgi:hypothetical protein